MTELNFKSIAELVSGRGGGRAAVFQAEEAVLAKAQGRVAGVSMGMVVEPHCILTTSHLTESAED